MLRIICSLITLVALSWPALAGTPAKTAAGQPAAQSNDVTDFSAARGGGGGGFRGGGGGGMRMGGGGGGGRRIGGGGGGSRIGGGGGNRRVGGGGGNRRVGGGGSNRRVGGGSGNRRVGGGSGNRRVGGGSSNRRVGGGGSNRRVGGGGGNRRIGNQGNRNAGQGNRGQGNRNAGQGNRGNRLGQGPGQRGAGPGKIGRGPGKVGPGKGRNPNGRFVNKGGRFWPVARGPKRFWWGGRWRTFVGFATLGALLIGVDYWDPDGYVAIAEPACFGVTEDGCQLRWQNVAFDDGSGAVAQCVSYCRRVAGGPPPVQVVTPAPAPAPVVEAPPVQATAMAPTPAPGGQCQITIFSEASFQGTSAPTNEDQPELAESGWANEISSIQVQAGTWDVYTEEQFGGNSMRLAPGQYPELGPEWTKKINSFMCVQK